MLIREETEEDVPTIRQVVRAAFSSDVEPDLADRLRADGDTVYSIVAEDRDEIIGHVMMSKVLAPDGCLCVSPVSVTPARQGQGVGSKLIRESIDIARRGGWQALFLLGNPAYYERFGFSAATADKFETDYPKPNFMAIELVDGALYVRSGPYTEPQAFQDLD